MRKLLYISALAIAAVGISSCSSEDSKKKTDENNKPEVHKDHVHTGSVVKKTGTSKVISKHEDIHAACKSSLAFLTPLAVPELREAEIDGLIPKPLGKKVNVIICDRESVVNALGLEDEQPTEKVNKKATKTDKYQEMVKNGLINPYFTKGNISYSEWTTFKTLTSSCVTQEVMNKINTNPVSVVFQLTLPSYAMDNTKQEIIDKCKLDLSKRTFEQEKEVFDKISL